MYLTKLLVVFLPLVCFLSAEPTEEESDPRLEKLKIDCELRTTKEILAKDKACYDTAAPADYKKKWMSCKEKFNLSKIPDIDFLPMWCKANSDKNLFLTFNNCVSDFEVFNRGDEAEISKYFEKYQACEDKYFDSKKHYAKLIN